MKQSGSKVKLLYMPSVLEDALEGADHWGLRSTWVPCPTSPSCVGFVVPPIAPFILVISRKSCRF